MYKRFESARIRCWREQFRAGTRKRKRGRTTLLGEKGSKSESANGKSWKGVKIWVKERRNWKRERNFELCCECFFCLDKPKQYCLCTESRRTFPNRATGFIVTFFKLPRKTEPTVKGEPWLSWKQENSPLSQPPEINSTSFLSISPRTFCTRHRESKLMQHFSSVPSVIYPFFRSFMETPYDTIVARMARLQIFYTGNYGYQQNNCLFYW